VVGVRLTVLRIVLGVALELALELAILHVLGTVILLVPVHVLAVRGHVLVVAVLLVLMIALDHALVAVGGHVMVVAVLLVLMIALDHALVAVGGHVMVVAVLLAQLTALEVLTHDYICNRLVKHIKNNGGIVLCKLKLKKNYLIISSPCSTRKTERMKLWRSCCPIITTPTQKRFGSGTATIR
jgi:hypothetical protein